jgi:hypothetical protein
MIGGKARPRVVPTQLAALAAGVSEATIRKWASRGRITRYGRPGRAEYDVGELIEIAVRRDQRTARGLRVTTSARTDIEPTTLISV